MKRMGGRDHDLWDEEDGFFYDVLRYPDGTFQKLRVRSLVGLIPLYAVERLEMSWVDQFDDFKTRLRWFMDNRQDLVRHCVNRIVRNGQETLALTIVDQNQLKRMLRRVVDEDEFLSDYGLRSLSSYHQKNPFVLGHSRVGYEPAEADSSNDPHWRGLLQFHEYFHGDTGFGLGAAHAGGPA
jgi:hypothetical protein